jgi:hypothetical protein
LGNRDLFLDPGTPFCPFGLLRWLKTGVTGLVPSKNEVNFIQIPGTRPEAARTYRKIGVELTQDGGAKGRVETSYYGQEALEIRLDYRNLDEPARKKAFETARKVFFPKRHV